MSTFFKGILFLIVVFSSRGFAQNILQYNLKVGDSIKVFQKATQDIVQNMEGSKHELKSIVEGDYTFVITFKTDSTYGMHFKFDRFRMLTTSNLYGEVMNVDTKRPAANDDVQGHIFLAMIGAPLKMELFRNGRIKQISGAEKMITKMVDKAGFSDDFTKQLMIESMKKEFGNEGLARSFEQMTFIYPNKKVKVGDTWSNYYKGKLTAKNIWTLNAINEKTIALSAKSDVSLSNKDNNVSMTLKGTQQTEAIVYKPSGFIKEMVVKQNTSGVSVMAQMKNVEIPTTITSTTTYKTIKYVQ